MPKSTDADATDRDGGAGRSSSHGWRPAAVVAAAVLLASVVPVPGEAPADPGIVSLTDPFHLLGYAALAAALTGPVAATLRDRIGFRTRTALRSAAATAVLAAVAATAFGVGVEAVQASVSWRSFATADALVNAAGALIGAVLAVAWRVRRSGRGGGGDRGGGDRNRGDADRNRA